MFIAFLLHLIHKDIANSLGKINSKPIWFLKTFLQSIIFLMLGYVIIRHKSQGAVISSKVMMNICEFFAQGLVYVMLFRMS